MAKLISKTYGEAFLELAVTEEKVDAFLEEIQMIRDVLKENPQFADIMKHPKITKEEKLQIIKEVFGGKTSDEITGFLSLIVNKDRYENIDEILTYFVDRVKEMKGIGVAYVTSPSALSKEQQEKIEAKLIQTTSYTEMEMHFAQDSALIGGLIIRIGDKVVDSSIRTGLENLERNLLKIQLQNETINS